MYNYKNYIWPAILSLAACYFGYVPGLFFYLLITLSLILSLVKWFGIYCICNASKTIGTRKDEEDAKKILFSPEGKGLFTEHLFATILFIILNLPHVATLVPFYWSVYVFVGLTMFLLTLDNCPYGADELNVITQRITGKK